MVCESIYRLFGPPKYGNRFPGSTNVSSLLAKALHAWASQGHCLWLERKSGSLSSELTIRRRNICLAWHLQAMAQVFKSSVPNSQPGEVRID